MRLDVIDGFIAKREGHVFDQVLWYGPTVNRTNSGAIFRDLRFHAISPNRSRTVNVSLFFSNTSELGDYGHWTRPLRYPTNSARTYRFQNKERTPVRLTAVVTAVPARIFRIHINYSTLIVLQTRAYTSTTITATITAAATFDLCDGTPLPPIRLTVRTRFIGSESVAHLRCPFPTEIVSGIPDPSGIIQHKSQRFVSHYRNYRLLRVKRGIVVFKKKIII